MCAVENQDVFSTSCVSAQHNAEVFASRFQGTALPLVETDDPTHGVPVGAFCCSLPVHVAAMCMALEKERSLDGRKLLKRHGVVRLGGEAPNDAKFAVHVTVAAASMMGDGSAAPWPAIQALLDSGAAVWKPGLRVPRWRKTAVSTQPRQAQTSGFAFTFCELFAGIGGFRLGFETIGGRCVFASEIDCHAATTYERNFGHAPDGDITDCDASDIPDFDILTAGFPCQSFTNIGARGGLDDPRGQLYRELCRVVSAKQPLAFLLENVKNLFNISGGRGHAEFAQCEPGSAFLTILHALEVNCGYKVVYDLISAEPWVPQVRERLYIVGFRPDNAEAAKRFKWPKCPETLPLTVRSFMEEPSSPSVAAAQLTERQWKSVQNSQTFQKCKHSRIVDLDKPARTLISSYKSGAAYYAEVILEERDGTMRDGELRPRFFTARECCRAMGFPESYYIPGDPVAEKGPALEAHQHFYYQIGNAVCAPVIQAIGVEILRALRPECSL